jgi:hypothetical protein
VPLDVKTRNILDKLRLPYRGMRLDETLLGLQLLGWTTEPIVTVAPLHYDDKPLHKDFRDANSADKMRDVLRDDLVNALPRNPTVDRYYVMDLAGPGKTIYSDFTITYRAWRGVEGWRVTSPTGETYELLAEPLGRARGRDRIKPAPLLRWLEKTSAPAAAQKMFLAERDARLIPDVRTRENTGTCGCCLRNIKLREKRGEKLPIVVLHGYRRPGDGHVVGHCLGEGYPPYELSDAATRLLRDIVRPWIANLVEHIERLRSGDIQEITILNRTTRRADVPPALWEDTVRRAVDYNKVTLLRYQKTLKACDELIADWKLRPLPKAGTEHRRSKDMYF